LRWGKALVANVADPNNIDSGSIVTRWPDGKFDIEVFPLEHQPGNLLMQAGTPIEECHPPECDFQNRWIQDEGGAYMKCAFELAETAAILMGIDEVRMDVFMVKGDPNGCRANENSISSGVPYGSNFQFLADVWYAGHKNRWYNRYDIDTPVYMQTKKDIPNLQLNQNQTFRYQTDYH